MAGCSRNRCGEPWEVALGLTLAADAWSARYRALDLIAEGIDEEPDYRRTWYTFCLRHGRETYVEAKRRRLDVIFRLRSTAPTGQ